MAQAQLKGYDITTSPDVVVIAREGLGEIRFSPGHSAALRHLLSIASKLEGAAAFPSPLRSTPFEIHFRELDGDVEVEVKAENTNHGVCLKFGEFDNFMGVVDEAFNIFQNEMQLSPQRPRRSAVADATTGESI